ncbi:hypothetical protein BGZ60DRAFT_385930, partial [Tricladium varicosporioides]
YIKKVTKRFDLINRKYPSTLLLFYKLEKNKRQASLDYIKEYQKKVKSILYIAIILQPDVAFTISQLSHFLTNLALEYITAID